MKKKSYQTALIQRLFMNLLWLKPLYYQNNIIYVKYIFSSPSHLQKMDKNILSRSYPTTLNYRK